MRQAGRCLADYRELRERYGILEMARTPELCARVTAMPVDQLGVDAAVLYADIMLPLDGMGVPFRIEPESARSSTVRSGARATSRGCASSMRMMRPPISSRRSARCGA